jgi:hypothetical protein
VHDDETVGRREATDLLAVRGEQLDGRRDEAAVADRRRRLLDARIRKAMPEARDVVGQLIGAAERLRAERVLVVQVARADLREGGAVATGKRLPKACDQVLDVAQNSGRPVSGVEASA